MHQKPATTPHPGQFRLVRLQIVNWGTFCGYKSFDIDQRGTLLTGPSGSGKSSLMDAHSMVLLPSYDHRFNASADLTARGAKQGPRSIADYVRGAWAETNDEYDQAHVRRLRGGEPTWSAVAATYDNRLGSVTTAVVVKWFTGVENETSALKTMHQIHSGHFDLRALKEWAERAFDTRHFKNANPDADFPASQDDYVRKLAKRIGLGSSPKTGLALLGKAKAMKNVGDLNLFVRDHMLDRPDTYRAAETMLANFTPLKEAHDTALRAWQQEKILHELPVQWQTYVYSQISQDLAVAARADWLGTYVRGIYITVLKSEIERLDRAIENLDDQLGSLDAAKDEAQDAVTSLSMQLTQKSANLERIGLELRLSRDRSENAEKNFARYTTHVEVAVPGRTPPETADDFNQLREDIAGVLREADAQLRRKQMHLNDAQGRLTALRDDLQEKQAESARLGNARSLIPKSSVDRRQMICSGIGIDANELPYTAELIDVDDERWRGAAERVLRSDGLRLLVPERHRDAVRSFVDGHNMRGLIEFDIVKMIAAEPVRPRANTLAAKLTITDHPFRTWLERQLARRCDHVCVETDRELDQYDKAVTVRGTVKLAGERYRKDDRPEVMNRSTWILGGNVAAKRAALDAEISGLQEVFGDAKNAVDRLWESHGALNKQVNACREAANFTRWTDLDKWTAAAEEAELEQQIAQLRAGDLDLQRLEDRRNQAKVTLARRFQEWTRCNDQLNDATTRQTDLLDRIDREQHQPTDVDDVASLRLLNEVRVEVEADLPGGTITPDNIRELRNAIYSALSTRIERAKSAGNLALSKVSDRIRDFNEKFPDAAVDTTGDAEQCGGSYAALHAEIESSRLPEATSRFASMISQEMIPSIATLQHSIVNAARGIEQRIDMVNESLARVEFDSGRYLRLNRAHQRLIEADDFRKQVDALMTAAGAKRNPELDDQRRQFTRVKTLMDKFTASGAAAERWRRNVLDVRSAFTFYGSEVAPDGTIHRTYRNTSSNSGGEQEKLVAFCLAAALSYNLADAESGGRPRFGTLMLDEAFSKSDERFATQALGAFEEFGFQLMIAAPIRMSGIVERYIGQAILVEMHRTETSARSNAREATFGELVDRRYREDLAIGSDSSGDRASA